MLICMGSFCKPQHHQISESNEKPPSYPTLITTSPVCLVDSGIWWILIVTIQCWFTCHFITQVPSPGLPQEEWVPRALDAKYLNCLTVREKNAFWSREDCEYGHSSSSGTKSLIVLDMGPFLKVFVKVWPYCLQRLTFSPLFNNSLMNVGLKLIVSYYQLVKKKKHHRE